MTTPISPSSSSAHPTNFRFLRGRYPAAIHLGQDLDAEEVAHDFGGLAPGYVYTREETRDILGSDPTTCIVVLSPSASLCTWRTFYSRERFEAFLQAYHLALVGEVSPGCAFLLRLPPDASRFLPLERVPWTRFANGRTTCGDDLDAYGYCGKPFTRGCDQHDELWIVHQEKREFERIRNLARSAAYAGPGEPPRLAHAASASMGALFEALYAARRFIRAVEQPFPGRGILSESALDMLAQARELANRVLEELTRRGIPVETRCPECDATDGLHATRCQRPACPGCGPHAPLAGLRYPVIIANYPGRAGVARCTTCNIYERDTDAAAALADARGTDYALAHLPGGGVQPYLPASRQAR